MSFGFAPSDIVLGLQACKWIWDNCYDKNNSADERYKELGSDVKLLEKRLRELEPALEDVLQRYEEPFFDALDFKRDLKELVGDFQQTLDQCKEVLQNHVRLQQGPGGFIQNISWATTAADKVDVLRRKIQFHTHKIYLVIEPVKFGLLIEMRGQLDEILALMRKHFSVPRDATPLPSIPEWLEKRFTEAILQNSPSSMTDITQIPLREGFDALYSNFRESTFAFRDPETADQTVEQYLNLLKSQWLLETIRNGSPFQQARPGSLFRRTMAQVEQRIFEQYERRNIVRFPDTELEKLNATAFSIWPVEYITPTRFMTDPNLGEEEILKLSLSLATSGGDDKDNLIMFRTGPTTLRIVVQKVLPDGYQESERFFNTHVDKFIPFYAIQQTLTPSPGRNSNTTSSIGISRGNGTGETSYTFKAEKDMLGFQRAVTGYQVVADCTVSWAIHHSMKLPKGRGKLQIWHWKPLTKDQGNRREWAPSLSESAQSPTTQLSLMTNTTLKMALEGKDLSHVSIREGAVNSLTIGASTPPLPALIIYTEEKGEYSYYHLELDLGIEINLSACECSKSRNTCKRAVIENKQGKRFGQSFHIRRMSVKAKDLSDWNLSVFGQPRHPDFTSNRVQRMTCKYLNLDFDSNSDRKYFTERFNRALELRDRAEKDLRALVNEMSFLGERPADASRGNKLTRPSTRSDSFSSSVSTSTALRSIPTNPPVLEPISIFSGLGIDEQTNQIGREKVISTDSIN